MKLKRFSLFVIFFSFSLFICLGSLKLTASASEEKKVTTYAVDFNGEYLDHGIGHFICRTTDSSCPKEIKERNSNYFVFEYIQNDEENPSYEKYAVVNISTLPEFIKQKILDSEIMYGIHEDNYWCEVNIRYFTETIKYNCLLYPYVSGNVDLAKMSYGYFAYIEFLNYSIDDIISIKISFDVYKEKGFLFWKSFDKKTFTSELSSDSILINGLSYKPDSFGVRDVFTKIENNYSGNNLYEIEWFSSPIQKLEEPLNYNGLTFHYKLLTGFDNSNEEFKNFFPTKATEAEKAFSIIDMTFLKNEITYYTDNLDLSYLIVEGPSGPDTSCIDTNINYIIIFSVIGLLLLFLLNRRSSVSVNLKN